MKKPFLILLKLFGFKREKPKTMLGKIVRRCEYAVTALAVAYLFLQLFPQVVFAHSVQAHGIRIYCAESITGDVDPTLSEIQSRIADSSLARNDQSFTVFICNSKWLYAFFSPLSRGSFGIANPVTQSIFVADAEVSRNQSRRFGVSHNARSFVSVVTHEAGHVLMRRRFGFWTNRKSPRWLKEGYCEMLAGESSFSEEAGDSLLAEGEHDSSVSFRYFTYRRMVEYLIQDRKMTIKELVRDAPDEEKVSADTRDWIRQRIIEPEAEGDAVNRAP